MRYRNVYSSVHTRVRRLVVGRARNRNQTRTTSITTASNHDDDNKNNNNNNNNEITLRVRACLYYSVGAVVVSTTGRYS